MPLVLLIARGLLLFASRQAAEADRRKAEAVRQWQAGEDTAYESLADPEAAEAEGAAVGEESIVVLLGVIELAIAGLGVTSNESSLSIVVSSSEVIVSRVASNDGVLDVESLGGDTIEPSSDELGWGLWVLGIISELLSWSLLRHGFGGGCLSSQLRSRDRLRTTRRLGLARHPESLLPRRGPGGM